MSIPISQFITPPPPPASAFPPRCPYVCSLHLCLYFCPATLFLNTPPCKKTFPIWGKLCFFSCLWSSPLESLTFCEHVWMEHSCLPHKSTIEKTMRAFCGGGGAASEFPSSSRSKQKWCSGSETKHHNITISIFSSFSVSTQTQNGSQKLAQRGEKLWQDIKFCWPLTWFCLIP